MTSEAVRAQLVIQERDRRAQAERREALIETDQDGRRWLVYLHPTKGLRRQRLTGRASLHQEQTHER